MTTWTKMISNILYFKPNLKNAIFSKPVPVSKYLYKSLFHIKTYTWNLLICVKNKTSMIFQLEQQCSKDEKCLGLKVKLVIKRLAFKWHKKNFYGPSIKLIVILILVVHRKSGLKVARECTLLSSIYWHP